MRTERTTSMLRSAALVCFVALCAVGLAGGCGKPGNSEDNMTNSFLTVSLNDDEPLQADVLIDGYLTDEVITASFTSEYRDSEYEPTLASLNTITLSSYYVSHTRSDGGPVPASFPGGLSVTIPPEGEAQADVVVVRGFDKNRSPLEELRDDGEIFTNTVVTFYGEDGYGNDVAITGSLSISFANFPD